MKITETTTRTTTSMRIKSHDSTYLKYLEDHPEAEAMEPDGVETIRKHSTDLAKQNIVTMSDLAAVYGNALPTSEQAAGSDIGMETLPQKPTEPTATIGDDNQGAGSEPLDSTYPYPPTPYERLSPIIEPKLQATGDPAQIYGIQQLDEVHNTMSNTGNFGRVADNQLSTVVQRVEAAVMAEMMPSDPMKMEEAGVRKEDGNESLNPDGTLRTNGMAGFDGKTQIPQINQSISVPGMDRTPIGDKWQGNVNDYRENGRPIIMATPTQKDMLTQLLGSRGFVSNEIGVQPVGSRFEHKMGGAIAKIEGSKDNQRLEVTITDRTGAPELVTDDWSSLYMYLQQKFPQEDN